MPSSSCKVAEGAWSRGGCDIASSLLSKSGSREPSEGDCKARTARARTADRRRVIIGCALLNRTTTGIRPTFGYCVGEVVGLHTDGRGARPNLIEHMKTVRERSVAGPCTILGPVLRETERYINYRDRHGTLKFISRRWAIHIEPCPSCPDHPKTKYPDGDWD
jgi:hypothetical protein